MSQPEGVDRREVMRRAVYLVGGAAALATFDAGHAFAADVPAQFFSKPRLVLLDAICATMIPKTDTPGAHEVGVPAVIDGMMTNWANDGTRMLVLGALDMIDAQAQAEKGKLFADLSPTDRLNVLKRFDASALSMGDKGYSQLKNVILTGYYLSEPGATVELRYIHQPGAWEADIPYAQIGRAWAVG
ncbi:MAG TPA: gluconate 2-dehydrogenase subunit 3 family protein [Rhizomicrobium sp.]|jgi:hypothetical protein